MNPLFPQFERALREAALREFRATRLGNLANELHRMQRGGGSRHRATQLMRELYSSSKAFTREARVDRYALFGGVADLGRAVAGAMRDFLRPIVNLIRGLAGGGATAAGGGPRGPRGPFGGGRGVGSSSGSGGSLPPAAGGASGGEEPRPFDAEIQTAIRFLEAFGYTVTPPGGQPGTPQPARPRPAAQPATPEDLGFTRQPPPNQIWPRSRVRQDEDPLFTGEMIEVESSNVHSIGYIYNEQNPLQGTLKVRFLQASKRDKSKGKVPGPLYYYHHVQPAVFDAFRNAGSKGGFVWDRLRVRGTVSGHRYQYSLRGIAEGYLPRKATRLGPNEYFLQRRARFQNVRSGEIQEFQSQLPDQFVQTLGQPRRGPQGFVPPERGTPDRGGPNRGTPNRGRP